MATSRHRQLATAVLVVAIVLAVWIAITHQGESAPLLLLGCCLLLVLLYYASARGERAERQDTEPPKTNPNAIVTTTLQQIVRSGGGSREAPSSIQIVIDGVRDPVLIIDMDCKVTAMNKVARAACRELLQEGEQVDCHGALQRLGASCEEPYRPCSLQSGEPTNYIHRRTTADGETCLAEIRMTPLRDENGQMAGVVEVVHDLNESEKTALNLSQAKEYAETVSRAKSESLAMISHEVRTPMNAVLGMVDLLQLTDLTRKQQAYVRTIQSSGNTLLSLVDNVLDYSELQAGELEIRKTAFDVRLFVENVIEMMGFQAYSKGLELGCRVERDVPTQILGDEGRLRQVLVNLVNNAVRFTHEGAVVIDVRNTISVDGESTLCCTVTDSGIGISDADKANLFVPFIRGDQPESGRKHGSGLGLTICKWLVDGMGGSIDVASDHGRGTRVSCALPFEVPGDAPAIESTPADLLGQHALVIHRDAAMAGIIGAYLTDWGMRCDAVHCAEAGFERLQSRASQGQPYDVAIVDANLPTQDGLSLARRIRSDNAMLELPITMLTPMAYPLEVGQISRIGGIRCVNKPVPPTELRHNLQRLIGVGKTGLQADIVGDTRGGAAEDARELRVLVAEDNALNRQLLLNLLMTLNYSADAVADGPSVLSALASQPYDLILMDCQMPGMDGDEVTRRIRSEPGKFRSQPVIVAVTANVSAQHRADCLESGMDDFIAKPVRRRQLAEDIQRWCADLAHVQAAPADAAPSQTPEQAVWAQLRNRSNDDNGFLQGYIDLFLTDTDARLKRLDVAATNQDWEVVRRESHALKGACLEMGALEIVRQCTRVNDATKSEDAAQTPGALHELKSEFDRIRPVFEAARNHFS